MTRLSGWCDLRGKPDCKRCRIAECECPGCGQTAQLSQETDAARGRIGADKRSPSRVLGRSATEASTDHPAKDVTGS